jgi:hypothetical protein
MAVCSVPAIHLASVVRPRAFQGANIVPLICCREENLVPPALTSENRRSCADAAQGASQSRNIAAGLAVIVDGYSAMN